MNIFKKRADATAPEQPSLTLAQILAQTGNQRLTDKIIYEDVAEDHREEARRADERAAVAQREASALEAAADILTQAGVEI